ncbi:hypothetical protein Pcinc_008656 [Petrolisthes cinctipes]|uniref:Uncharacterized protein n=1 Tax=Petrolisthes cinctipes TaxID=88211 RepID=A0AAE1G653_PETCI|nr:hypothetical protein Pcinc_008656 [Petrolisthes cinctipes]
MDSFLGKTRPFFQGLPSSTRGYDGSPDDPAHAQPNPTPPVTPTLTHAHAYHHAYHPVAGGVIGSAATTSLPGLLPPSRPITASTPSHKSSGGGEHYPTITGAGGYSVSPLLPPSSKSYSDVPYHYDLLKHPAVAGSRATNPLPDPRTAPISPYSSSQAALMLESRFPSRPFSVQPSSNPDNRSLTRPYTTQTPSLAEARTSQHYSTYSGIKTEPRSPVRPYITQATPTSDLRAYPHPFSPPSLASDVRSIDTKYLPRNEGRSNLRAPEARSSVRTDFHSQQWGQPYRTPEAKPLENLAPSVQISTTPNTVNGSKDALYLGRKQDDITSHRRSDDPYVRSVKTLQLNGSRDPLYPNGSHPYSSSTQREPSLERPVGSHTKEDSALDLSVKTVKQTPDSTAPEPEKSSNVSSMSTPGSDRLAQGNSVKCLSNSVPTSSPSSRASKDPSPLPRGTPGISGAPRVTPPSHIPSPYGINGSPSPLPSSNPLGRVPHILPPAKRPGDPMYAENCAKLPRRSHSPSASSSRPPPLEAHYPVHPSDKSLYAAHKEQATEHDIKSLRETLADKRQLSVERRDMGNEWKDPNIERRIIRDPSIERNDLSYESRDRSAERRGLSLERRDISIERRDISMEKWNMNSMLDSKYLQHTKHAESYDSYRALINPSEQSRANSSKAKYPASVPTTLPQHGATRVPPAQPPHHPYSTYNRPPDPSSLPHTSPHTYPSVPQQHHPQTPGMGQTVQQSKIYQPHTQQGSSRGPHTPVSHPGISHPSSQSSAITTTTTTTTSGIHSYPYPYTTSQTAASAHYHQQLQQKQQQQLQQHQQQRSLAHYPPFTMPQPTKPSSLPPPHHQSYPYPSHRTDPTLALYPPKRSNQMSPHPSNSPHPSISPHPSASPHLSASSPHSSVSPHPLAPSPRPGVSPHPSHQQGWTPHSSPHPAHRLPTSSPVQLSSHAYPGSLPPSPYQSYSNPPSRPSSATGPPPPPSPHHFSKSPGAAAAAHPLQPPPPHSTRPTDLPPQEHPSQAHIQQSISTLRHLSQAYSSHLQQIQPGSSSSSSLQTHPPSPATSASSQLPATSQIPPEGSQAHSSYSSQQQGPSDPAHIPPHSQGSTPTGPHVSPQSSHASPGSISTNVTSHTPPKTTQAPSHTPPYYSTSSTTTSSSSSSSSSSILPPQSGHTPPTSTVPRPQSRPTHSPSRSVATTHSPSHSSRSPSHSTHIPPPHPSAHSSDSSLVRPPSTTLASPHPAQAPPQQSYVPSHSTASASSRPPPMSHHAPPSHGYAPHSKTGPSYPSHYHHGSYTSAHSTTISPTQSVQAPPHAMHAPSSYSHTSSQQPSYAMSHHTSGVPSSPHAPSRSAHTNSSSYSAHTPRTTHAGPHTTLAPSQPTHASTHSTHVSVYPSHSAPPHPSRAPPYPPHAPSHSSSSHAPNIHAPPHSTHAPVHSPYVSQQSYVSPRTTNAPTQPPHAVSSYSSTHAPPQSPQHAAPHTTHASSHPGYPPHPVHGHHHPSYSSHASSYPPHPSQVPPHPSYPPHSSTHPSQPLTHSSQVHPYPSQTPTHPSQAAPYPPSHPYAQAYPHPSYPYGSHSQGPSHPPMATPRSSTQATPTTQSPQASPRSTQAHPHPTAPGHHPPHPYPPHPQSQSYPHPAQSYPHSSSSQSQGHPPTAHPPRSHISQLSASQRSHSHAMPSVRPSHHTQQPSYHHQPNTSSQSHLAHRPPTHPPPHLGTHHPHYHPPRFPHPPIKTEDTTGGSQYPGYGSFPPHQSDVGTARNQQDPTTVRQPEFTTSNSRTSQDADQSRIRTKGEQKSFDPKNAMVGPTSIKPDPWPAFPANGPAGSVPQNQHTNRVNESLPDTAKKAPGQLHSSQLSEPREGQKVGVALDIKEEEHGKQDQSISKTLEPGKAALAEKLQKKIQRAESLESIPTKKEAPQEKAETKKEEPPPEENEWDSGFSKLLEDLATNPEGVTSKKSKTLGRRYLQKVQIQQAIDSDLIAPPPSYVIEEEEEESEPEPPVKFRGKFKSIKDKKVERLILTYASHSDESATEMIPDEDASDFEEELKREIRSKDKKRGHTKKPSKSYDSSGSESGKKEKGSRKSGGRGRNKENKPNNKQDMDFSYSSSGGGGSGSSSTSSSSSSSDSNSSDGSNSSSNSDSEESEVEEIIRPRRRGKNSRKWETESSDSEEEVIPRRRTRRGYQSSSEEDTNRQQQKNKKRKKKQESSDSDDVPLKARRGKRKKKWDSDEDEEFVGTRKSKKKGRVMNKKQQKRRKHDASDEESDNEEIVLKKTRGRKKKVIESKKPTRRKQQQESSDNSSSESEEEIGARRMKKLNQRKRGTKKPGKTTEESSENSDIQTKKKILTKGNRVIDSDDSEDNKQKSDLEKEEKDSVNAQLPVKEKDVVETSIKKEDIKKEPEEEVEEAQENNLGKLVEEEEEDDMNLTNDSVVEKLRKTRDEELNREDVREMQSWLNEVNSDIKKQLGGLRELTIRHCWKKPQFGAGDDFLQGWQTDVKKYKELAGRFPKKLCQATKHHVTSSTKGSPKKGRGDRDSGKDSPLRQGSSSPAKNTRSKSGIIKTSMAVAEDNKLKVPARPEISSVMQKFFEKVLADSSNDCTKIGLAAKKFNLGPYSNFGTQRVPTGLTPTPSVAPSMMASDDSDLDSLASLRTDLPASDSIPVSKRSIASSLLKKIGRKYNDKRLSSLYQSKSRSVLEATNKPQLLPTPGMPTTEKDLKDMSPDQIKIATFFRKETVSNYRDNFEVIVTKNGINEFTPILYQSRTRKRTKQIQDAATVRSVFGSDIPPHLVKKVEESKARKQVKKEKKEDGKGSVKDETSPVPISRASTPAGSVLAAGDDDDDSELRSERSESVLGESSVPQTAKKARRKFRKFRSGFDYIRKKKKVKPDDEATPSRKRIPVRRHVNWPEESRDVAAEVRNWVVNKGLGETVLHKAARLQYHDVVVYCAESPDFDINVRDNAGYTPLHEACNRGHLDIAQVLCAHGAIVNAPGYKGMRPLHEAVENGHGELARLLLAYGADPALTTYAGQTCLALCADIHTTRLVEGYLADLKGQIGETWHFTGPTRFFDPEEQGCDVFSNIPASMTSQNQNKVKDGSLQITATSQSINTDVGPCSSKLSQDLPEKDNNSRGQLPDESEKLTVCPQEASSEVTLSPKKEVVTDSEDKDKETTDTGKESEVNFSKQNEINSPVSKCIKEELTEKEDEKKEDSDDDDSNGKQIILAWSESPLLDLYQVNGRPHSYYLMSQLLDVLAKTQTELVMAARTIETLELDIEEFEACTHSCTLGSSSRTVVENQSTVILVRVTPAVDQLLGIETLTI